MKKRNIKIGVSILSSDFFDIQKTVDRINSSRADFIHFDIMDGVFVPNISYGPHFVKCVRAHTAKKFDVHLMIREPLKYIPDYVAAGADVITLHAEAKNPMRALKLVKSFGLKCGIVINPQTKVATVKKYLSIVDYIMVMTVQPGFGGQLFMQDQVEKIARISDMIKSCGRKIMLEVDGGVNFDTAKISVQNGADVLVVGSFLFKQKNFAVAVEKFKSL